MLPKFSQKQPPRGVPKKGVLKIYNKFKGEQPCRSAISLQHGCSPVNLLHVLRTPFFKNSSERELLFRMIIIAYFYL